MSEVNGYSELRDQYPELSKDEIIELIPDSRVDEFRIGDFEINNPVAPDYQLQSEPPVTKASIDGFEVNKTVDDSWEVNVLGVEMNDRDDVYTVGLVVIVALLVYTAKVAIDHWFNKRLELYKKKIGVDK